LDLVVQDIPNKQILVRMDLEVEIQDLESTMLQEAVVVVVVVLVLDGVYPQIGVDLVVELVIVILHLELSWVMEFLAWDTTVDGVEIIQVELQTTLQEVAVVLLKMVKIIERDLMQEMVEMDYLMIFLVALFTMELVVAVVFIPMVMVDLVELVVAVMVVTMVSQVKLTKEVLLLDMETVVAVVDIPMRVDLDLVES
jgi:hypothetical protein